MRGIKSTMVLKALISSSSYITITTSFYSKRFISSLSTTLNTNSNFNLNTMHVIRPLHASSTSTDGGNTIQGIENMSSKNNNMTSIAFAAVVTAASLTTTLDNNKEKTSNIHCDNNNDTSTGTTMHVATVPHTIPEECLTHDHYNGITLNIESLPSSITDNPLIFESALINSLNIWSKDGKRGIWIKMSREHSALIPHCTDLGFDFQHAKKGQLTLTKWLPKDSESRLPLGPSHQIGVGALIFHPDTKQMLVVQEKRGPAAARKLWKMPTGLSDPGEDLTEAVIREVKEETGLNATFEHILCLREAHPTNAGSFSHSDLFFVCLLTLTSKEKEEIILQPQEEEIEAIQWMDVKDYCAQATWVGSPLYNEMNAVIQQALKEAERKGDDISKGEKSVAPPGFGAKKLPVGWRPGSNTIYSSKL